jgi:L-histidine Nalpha-methyltransferase / hercynylcysteine S-oxide synthase
LNGLIHVNKLLGETAFILDDWRVIGEYVYDSEGGRHQAFYSPTRDVRIQDIQVKAGERVQVEQSLKYSSEDAQHLWEMSGMNEVKKWSATSEAYSKYYVFIFAPFFLHPGTIVLWLPEQI